MAGGVLGGSSASIIARLPVAGVSQYSGVVSGVCLNNRAGFHGNRAGFHGRYERAPAMECMLLVGYKWVRGGDERAGFSAEARLDRRDFRLGWSLAPEAGGILIGNKVKISLEVEAVRQG